MSQEAARASPLGDVTTNSAPNVFIARDVGVFEAIHSMKVWCYVCVEGVPPPAPGDLKV